MIVAVGSCNPVKVKAVRNVIGDKCQLLSMNAQSSVSEQPLSSEETRLGAIARAKDCLLKSDAVIGIGLEGGVELKGKDLFLCSWTALVGRNGKCFVSNGPQVVLPQLLYPLLLGGKNLSDAIHTIYGVEDIRVKEGAMGFFTNGQISREEMFTYLVRVVWGQYHYFRDCP